MTTALLPASAQAAIGDRLPGSIDVLWWADGEELVAHAPNAEIAWIDMLAKAAPLEALRRAEKLQWLSTAFAGVDWLPLDDLRQRKITLTNGSGLTAAPVAEFALLGMLAVARGYRDIVRAQDRGEWLDGPPATRELAGSRALIIGNGAIGQAVGRMLRGFDVEVVPVSRSGGAGVLRPEEWRAQIGSFDWVVLALPGTPETAGMIDAETIAAMKTDAVLVNVARADVIDQDALIAALENGRIGGAVLDLTDPEPLPPGHRLWTTPNCHVTMHLAGVPTQASFLRAVDRLVENCIAWEAGQPLTAQVDLDLGY